MGSYLGYGLQAGVQGFQSGFNMGQMKWQQNEKKKLEKKQEEMMQSASIFNNMVAQLGEDGSYSEDDMMKINTSYMALSYDTKDRVDGTYKAIQAMDKKTIEENYQWFDFVIETTNGMKSADAQGIFDAVRPFVSGEKGLQIYEGLESITKKKGEIASRPQTVSPYEFYGDSPANVQTGIAESVAGQTPGLEGVEFKEGTAPITDIKKAEILTKIYNAKNEQLYNVYAQKWGLPLYQEAKVKLSQKPSAIETKVGLAEEYGATEEDILNFVILDKGGGGTTTPTSFKILEAIKESFKNVKTKAEYDSALQSYNSSKEAKTSDWTPPSFEGQLTDLIKKVEGAIWADYVNKDGKLKSKGDAEEYNANLQHYLRLIEEAEREGIDVSRFQAFKPYEFSGFMGMGNMSVTSESW